MNIPTLFQTASAGPAGLTKRRASLYKMAVSAVFLSLTLAMKLVSTTYLPVLGAAGIKISISGIISVFPSLLFGPLYGAVVCGLSDFIMAVLFPTGAYIPWLTVTAALSGFLMGLFWQLLNRLKSLPAGALRGAISIFLAVLMAFGGGVALSLRGDGLMPSAWARAEELPTKNQVEGRNDLSPLSALTVSLVRYTKDTYTVTALSADQQGCAAVPDNAYLHGGVTAVTKLAADAISPQITRLYLPATLTGIDKNALGGRTDLTIITPAGSKADEFARAAGLPVVNEERTPVTVDYLDLPDGISIKSNDNVRSYLAGYINFLTWGMMGFGLAGLVLLWSGALIRRLRGKTAAGTEYAMLFCAIFPARLIVTIINTQILRIFLAAWNGRAFMILLIPRIVEEVIGNVLQVYLIMLLYNIYQARIAPILRDKLFPKS